MESYTRKEREQYNQYRANVCETLGITANQYNWLRRKGEALSKADADYCNGDVFTMEEEYDCAKNVLMGKVRTYIDGISVYVLWSYHQSDPRGCALYLSKEPISADSYSQTATAIY